MGYPVVLIRSEARLWMWGVARTGKMRRHIVWVGVSCVKLDGLAHIRVVREILSGTFRNFHAVLEWSIRKGTGGRRKLARSVLSAQERKLLSETRDILEELLD
jgi:hypothetical protein